MRIVSVLFLVVLFAGIAVGQTSNIPGTAGYGCGAPYVPLITTPQISLDTVSPSPVGASNATYGLVAGATNATLSVKNLPGNTGGTYIQPVWYEGGTAPLISSPSVRLPYRAARLETTERIEGEHERAEAAPQNAWIYYTSENETSSAAEASASARSGRRAARTITNQDVEQENQKNGSVKYDDKTEQLK